LAVDAGAFAGGPPAKSNTGRRARLRLSGFLWRRPWLKATGLLSPPLLAFVVVYIGALAVVLVSSFWSVNAFTSEIEHTWTLANYRTIFSTSQPYLHIAALTLEIAAAVTLTDAILAFPLAFFMARLAGKRTRALLFVLVLLPLWSSYLVRIYAWQTILSHNGALNWTLNGLGLPDQNVAYSNTAMWIVFSYVWLPFMVLPVYAALERIPDSYLEASADLGARGWRTFRSVILPLALPGVVAGSIFTFALTLGDYITPLLVGGPSSTFIGNVVYENFATNVPFAAAFTLVPLLIMGVYLLVARRLGAFEAL
jgi:putative spermidine/putrescine transport system permease protein